MEGEPHSGPRTRSRCATAYEVHADERLATHTTYGRDSATGLGYRKGKSTLKVRCFSSERRGPNPRRTPATATTLRRGLISTECLYVKLPCPSVHASYATYSSQLHFITWISQRKNTKGQSPE